MAEQVVVETNCGEFEAASKNVSTFFKGAPYAQSPEGDLRRVRRRREGQHFGGWKILPDSWQAAILTGSSALTTARTATQ